MTISNAFTPRRRGVILLLVLAVMAMFAMLIATFLVISTQQYRLADSAQKVGRYVQSPEDDLHATALQLLVGSHTESSVIRAHSLGATRYGDANVPGLIGAATWDRYEGKSNELHRFYLDYDNTNPPTDRIDWRSNVGSVFSVRHPKTLKWHSARIIDADYDENPSYECYYVDVRDFPGISDPTILTGVDFLINPPDFAGTGAGYVRPNNEDNTTAGFWVGYASPMLSAGDDGIPFARQLNINAPLFDGSTFFKDMLDGYDPDGLRWSLNVDYTAPDAASPFLGWFDLQFNGGVFDPSTSVIIPSYHRPSLVALYGYDSAEALRKVVARPLPIDHREFDGSNPTLATTTLSDLADRLSDSHGRYLDVDTDGNGIKDAVWVDVGLPVRTDLKGRTYKPLVAIKCVDLDGRLNLNTIGNLAEAGLLDNDFLLGSGFGPAGINLSRGLNMATWDNINDATLYDDHAYHFEDMVANLMRNRYLGRNGEMVPRDADTAMTNSILALFGGLSPLGMSNSLCDYFGNLPDYWEQGSLQFDPLGNRYNSFLDLDNILYSNIPYSLTDGAVDGHWPLLTETDDASIVRSTNPYLFDPNRRTPYDRPFTLSELEAVLRQNDIDKNSLPERLRSILGYNDADGYPMEPNVLKVSAYHTTTLSNDVPVPGPALADMGYTSLYELIRSCVEKEADRNGSEINDESIDAITLQLIRFLPDEIKQGGKINLNKLVEDPAMFLHNLDPTSTDYEDALYERMKMARGIYIILMALSYDKLYGVPKNDGTNDYIVEPYIEPSFLQAKKISDLYKKFKPTEEGATSDAQAGIEFYQTCRELAATRLAQWAINVVEFTDVDAVMTPFIFDINPFDDAGWGERNINDEWRLGSGEHYEFSCIVDNENYRLIWGMERPDLLLTETLAFQNRSVADTSNGDLATEAKYVDAEQSGENGLVLFDTAPSDQGDRDFDQIRMPQGSAFLELYCAADANRPYYPQELYNGNQLDIGRVSSNGFPIWQVMVSGSNYKVDGSSTSVKTEVLMENSIMHRMKDYGPLFSFQPKQPNILGTATPDRLKQKAFGEDSEEDSNKDRYVWFSTQPPVTATHGIENKTVYYNHSGAVGLVPGEYLVVGPRLVTHFTSKVYGVEGNGFGVPYGPKIDLSYDSEFKATQLVFATSESESAKYSERINRPKVMIAAAQVDHNTQDLRVKGGQTPVEWVGGTIESQTLTLEQVYRRSLWLGNGLSNPVGLGFSISEPFRDNYYTQPKNSNPNLDKNADNDAIIDAYGNLSSLSDNQDRMEEQPSSGSKPLTKDGLVGTGVAPLYKSAFLQRLADPLRPYDATTNPYITVDWNMFDLKVYSGESADGTEASKEKDLYFKAPLEEGSVKFFSSRQWDLTHGNNQLPNPWSRNFDFAQLPDKEDNKENLSDFSTTDMEKCGLYEAINLENNLALSTLYQLPYQEPFRTLASGGRLANSQFPVHSLGRFGTNPLLLHPNKVATEGAETIISGYVPMGNHHADAICAAMGVTGQANIERFKNVYLGSPVYLSGMKIGDLPVTADALDSNNPRGFLHLPWHNGPMANSYEVMQVPASAPGRFGVEFVDRKNDKNIYAENYLLQSHLWDSDIVAAIPDLTNSSDPFGDSKDVQNRSGSLGSNVRFGHLLNFQHAHGNWWVKTNANVFDQTLDTEPLIADADLSTDTPNEINFGYPHLTFDYKDSGSQSPPYAVTRAEFVSLDLGNFLNFVNVPSRFVGTRDWFSYYDQDKGQNIYYSYSRFREPGKINLNTASAPELAALLENREFAGNKFEPAVYDQFDFMRGNNRTHSVTTESFLFETPFRSSSSSLLNVNAAYTSSVDATLLQSERELDDNGELTGQSTGMPIFAPKLDKVGDSYRSDNSYTALEGIQRLSDMTTTRSNVFAVWMTLGYFEVEKIQPGNTYNGWTAPSQPTFDAVYPDGYMLKKEVGLETGEIKRHRAFYIIDRSVPFGYRRGQKLNSEDAILLKRFIE